MEVDVIIILRNGKVDKIEIVEDETTAEATFDSLVESEIGNEDFEDYITSVDYGSRLNEANSYFEGIGIEIVWNCRIEVNSYKNESD